MRSSSSTLLALVLLTACAGAKPPEMQHEMCPTAAGYKPPWVSTLDVSSPLVGKAWDAHAHALIAGEWLGIAALPATRFVLLGEKHDNPDHHLLQAQALKMVLGAKRHPVVLFEQIDLDLQPAIDAYLAKPDATVDGLGHVLEWEKRGWPEWSLYRPIFEVAMESHLTILATGLGHELIRAVVKQGIGALPADLAARLHLERPLAPELEASLDEELKASHCGFLPDDKVAPMRLAQRVKDALMADLMLAHDTPDGAVLIAGNGHVRSDRGVPWYLHAARPDAHAVSISFVEVEHGVSAPAAYAADQPADYLVFTPRLDDDDPCADFQHPK